ncbi:MAG: hypothetical protein HOE90_20575 [Bacteriovoracaceae bacterium]|jgi:flagellar protein FliL|nr:hypothetical protein [Bacteriovoracaceae bacterium]
MAEEENEQEGAEVAKKESTPSQKSPLVLLLLIVNAAGIGAIAFMQFQSHQKEMAKPDIQDVVKAAMEKKISEEDGGEEEAISPIKKDKGLLLPLEGFTANLAQGDGPRRFVRLNAVLKFSSSSKSEEFEARKPQIRDTIISILNSKRPEDLLKKEGKVYLKEEIKASINSFLIDGKVVDIFYVGFQIN